MTMEALSDLQAEYMADDVELTEEMMAWTEAEARVLFEHMLRPTPAETWRLWFPGWCAPAQMPRCRAVCLHNAGSSASMWTRDGMQLLSNDPRIELLAVSRARCEHLPNVSFRVADDYTETTLSGDTWSENVAHGVWDSALIVRTAHRLVRLTTAHCSCTQRALPPINQPAAGNTNV